MVKLVLLSEEVHQYALQLVVNYCASGITPEEAIAVGTLFAKLKEARSFDPAAFQKPASNPEEEAENLRVRVDAGMG